MRRSEGFRVRGGADVIPDSELVGQGERRHGYLGQAQNGREQTQSTSNWPHGWFNIVLANPRSVPRAARAR